MFATTFACMAVITANMNGVFHMDIERLKGQLEFDEGVVHKIYKDSLGYKTFGIGHLVTKKDPEYNKPVGTRVLVERIANAFVCDYAQAVEDCKDLYSFWDEVPDEAQEVLVNMMFNLGRTKLSKFKNMNGAVKRFSWKEAALHGRDSLWYNQVGPRADRLMERLENVENFEV